MSRRGGTYNERWGAGRTGGATCEENTRTGGDFMHAEESRVWEDDRERARRKKITTGSTLANCQLSYVKPLEMAYF